MRLYLCLVLALLSPAASFAVTIRYSYERLDWNNFSPSALNNRGWMTGSVVGSRAVPMRYRPGIGYESLSANLGGGNDINDAGTIVGRMERAAGVRAFVRPKGQPWTDIGTLGGTGRTSAQAINNAGQVVGYSSTATGVSHAFLYTAEGGMQDLGTLGGDYSWASAINNAGQILGGSLTADRESHTFLYDPVEGMIDLEEEMGSNFGAMDLSGNGTLVGAVRKPGTEFTMDQWSAGVYSRTTGLRRLGTLGGTYGILVASNERGWAVGESTLAGDRTTRAMLYVYGRGLMSLNDLTPGLDVPLFEAVDINDRDQLLARGGKEGMASYYYLLTRIRNGAASADMVATPEPSTWALLAVGLVSIGVARRRR